MSRPSQTTRPPQTLKSREDEGCSFLDKHYHHLCRSVRPDAFLSWLRQKSVFTLSDQEEVENKYVTSAMKVGVLIDIIKTRGHNGFKAFMEVIEYEYPEVFSSMTGEQPRDPPTEYLGHAGLVDKPSRRARQFAGMSAEILAQMGDLVHTISQDNGRKKEEVMKLNSLVIKLERENEDLLEEKRSVYVELKTLQDAIEVFQQQHVELQQKLEKQVEEKERMSSQLMLVRTQKDTYMMECTQLRKERDSLDAQLQELHGAMDRQHKLSRTMTSQPPETSDKLQYLRLENHVLQKELDQFKTKLSNTDTNAEDNKRYSIDEMTKKCAQFEEVDKQLLVMTFDKSQLESRVADFRCQLKLQTETCERLLVNVEEIKTERDQILLQCQELEVRYNQQVEENRRLSADCRQYTERFCNMSDKIRSLYLEIDQLQSSRYSLDNETQLLTNNKDNLFTESPARSFRTQIRQTPGCCPGLRRCGGIKNREFQWQRSSSNGTMPLIVYGPEPASGLVYNNLQSEFDLCPMERQSCNEKDCQLRQERNEIINFEHCRDGSFLCLTIERLKQQLRQSSCHVLLQVPAIDRLSCLQHHQIDTLVVIINIKDEGRNSSQAGIEKFIKKENIEILELTSAELKDTPQVAKSVLEKINARSQH